ncbi:MAG: glucans biosynthesis glucosyltransferase MdoH [Myxococcota bacterium]
MARSARLSRSGHPDGAAMTTPLQPAATLQRRRRLMLALNVATWLALTGGAAVLLGAGGWTSAEVALLGCVAWVFLAPSIDVWNTVVGLVLLHARSDGDLQVAPFLTAADERAPIRIRTAVLMTLRNEDVPRALLRLQTVKASLDRTGEGDGFDYFVLSDTSDAAIAEEEERRIARWHEALGEAAGRVVYRRRAENTGYKAGNVRDFCERWGAGYELMVPLDADSLMSGTAVLELVRVLQRHPRIGILQTRVDGLPSATPLARLLQLGGRGMRALVYGMAWRLADCGPYWGHNAAIRVAPFTRHCALPVLPGRPPFGGHLMSHDYAEAALMSGAGYEVRLFCRTQESWEDLPPTLTELLRREIRWCRGNLQYVGLLRRPDVAGTSRLNLAWLVLGYLALVAQTGVLALLPVATWQAGDARPAVVAVSALLLLQAPRALGALDVLLTPGAAASLGGPLRTAASSAAELRFHGLVSPVSALTVSSAIAQMLLTRRAAGWGGQQRDARAVSWGEALAAFWPHTLFGVAVTAAMWLASPALCLATLPWVGGPLLAVPLAVATAHPRLARLVPEAPPTAPEVAAVVAGVAG